jgi:hypothetical protein
VAADAHLQALEELEKKHQNAENELSEQMKTISAELAVLFSSFFIFQSLHESTEPRVFI